MSQVTTATTAARVSRLERLAAVLPFISALILAGYLLYRLGIIPLARSSAQRYAAAWMP